MDTSRRLLLKQFGLSIAALCVPGYFTGIAHGKGLKLKIGVLGPVSGYIGLANREILNGVKVAVDEINNKGLLPGIQIEPAVYDADTVIEAVGGMKRLASQKNLLAVISPIFSWPNKALSEIAEAERIPLFISNPFMGGLHKNNLKFTFRIQPDVKLLTKQLFKYILKIAKNYKSPIRHIGIFHEDRKKVDPYGDWKEATEQIIGTATENGLRVSYNWPMPVNQDAAVHLTKDALRHRTELILLLGFPKETNRLLQSMRNQKIQTKAIMGFANIGLSSQLVVKKEKNLMVNVMDTNCWGNPHSRLTQNFKASYNKQFGAHPSNGAYYSFTVISLIREAIKNYDTVNKDKLSVALRTKEFKNHVLAQRGSVRFDAQGRNINATSVLLQVSNPIIESVYPDIFAESNPKYPSRYS